MQCFTIEEQEKEYPKRLLEIRGHPKRIYAVGNLELLNQEKGLAIVGSRKCSKKGEEEAGKLAKYLSAQGICIVSGMAIGIDAIAHAKALQEVGKTIAVLPSGLNNIYPKENEKLYQQILEQGGCIISEYKNQEKVNMQNFSKRNRLIAGLAKGVLVVEAKYRSGSSITAKHAKLQHKPVFCLPREVENKNGVGTNRLIQKGANLITKPEDIMKYYQFEIIKNQVLEQQEREVHKEVFIEKEHESVYQAIKNTPTNIEVICKKSKKDIAEVMSILTVLELEGSIEQLAGNHYQRR